MSEKQARETLDGLEKRLLPHTIMNGMYGTAVAQQNAQHYPIPAAQDAFNNAIAQQMMHSANTIGPAQYQQMAQPPTSQVRQEFKMEFGVMYLGSSELADDWRGAQITGFTREMRSMQWDITLVSKWDKSLAVHVYFDAEDTTGKEVNELAKTFMEALNQRRVG